MKTLVVGCDASGKSTLLAGIHRRYGDAIRESTRSDVGLAFKRANIDRRIDGSFIDEREAFYLDIERQERDIARDYPDIATTNATLITRLSHDVMRRCIGLAGYDDEDIISRWFDDEEDAGTPRPDIIAFTYAPFATICARIVERQQAGMQDERFWGFNSPFFLERYQERWRRLMPALGECGLCYVTFDTAIETPEQIMTGYATVRHEIMEQDKV